MAKRSFSGIYGPNKVFNANLEYIVKTFVSQHSVPTNTYVSNKRDEFTNITGFTHCFRCLSKEVNRFGLSYSDKKPTVSQIETMGF